MKPEVFLRIIEQKRHLIGLGLFVVFLLSMILYITLQSPPDLSPVTGKLVIDDMKPQIPDFTFETEAKEKLQFHSLKGKVVLLSFWASWCAPCQVELPMFEKLREKYRRKDFVIVAINLDDLREDAIAFKNTFWKKHKIKYPTYFDINKKAAAMLDIQALPTNFLIDKEMRVVFESTGLQDWNAPEVKNLIEELML